MNKSEARRVEEDERKAAHLRQALEPSEMSTVANALRVAADRFRQDAKDLRNIAAELRAGKPIGMFANGESGARGADRLAEQFERQEKDSLELYQRFEV